MAEDGKSTITEVRDAWNRTKSALKKTEEKVERSAGALMRTTLTNGGSFIAGALHEGFGKMDARLGQKVIRVGGVHLGILGNIAGLGAELLEAGGKNSEWIGTFSNGVGAQASGDFGRVFTRQLKSSRAEREAEKKKADEKKAAEAQASTEKKSEEKAA